MATTENKQNYPIDTQIPVTVVQAEIRGDYVWTMLRIGAGHPIEVCFTKQQALAADIIEKVG
ncbi:MAG: hypothetical protein ACREAA_04880 [Candidatus Polarisedimenticolia bacterium]